MMLRYLIPLLAIPAAARSQVCYDSSTQIPCPTINNGISSTMSVSTPAVRLVPQSGPPFACGASTKGLLAFTSTGALVCKCDGSNWTFLLTGLSCSW